MLLRNDEYESTTFSVLHNGFQIVDNKIFAPYSARVEEVSHDDSLLAARAKFVSVVRIVDRRFIRRL